MQAPFSYVTGEGEAWAERKEVKWAAHKQCTVRRPYSEELKVVYNF